MRAVSIPWAVDRLAVLGVIALAGVLACEDRALERAQAFYGGQPLHLRPIPHQPVPRGLASLRAEACGACHAAIYEEWRVSTHAQAFRGDAQYLEELKKSAGQGIAWMCVNCHTPLVNQLETLVVGLEDGRWDRPIEVRNPVFDEQLQDDAIGCATCHVRDGVVLGPYGDTDAPHPVRKSRRLTSSSLCTQCHQANDRFDPPGVICVFDTGREHAESPQGRAGKTCQSCHMPELERPTWAGGSVARPTRRHWFGGSMIPKHPDLEEAVAALRPHFPPGLAVRWVGRTSTVAVGVPDRLEVEIENARAGHRLPTGDPERFLRVVLTATGPDDAVIAEKRVEIGARYAWRPKPRLLSDDRLAPGERRRLALTYTPDTPGPVRLRVEAWRYRINEANFAYHELEGRYVAGQRFFVDERTVEAEAQEPARPTAGAGGRGAGGGRAASH